ncbi:acyl-CoA thioesterase [Arthrobacter monumenti]
MSAGFRTSSYVRWSDMDLNGHVNNARVVTLLEEARIQWRAQLENIAPVDRENQTVVASLQLDYLAPTEYGSDVDVDITVTRIGTRSYTLNYAGSQVGMQVFKASTVMVPMEQSGAGARPLTAIERQELSTYQTTGLNSADMATTNA